MRKKDKYRKLDAATDEITKIAATCKRLETRKEEPTVTRQDINDLYDLTNWLAGCLAGANRVLR